MKWVGQEAPTKAEDTDHSGRRSQEDPKRGREDGAAGFTHLAIFLWLTVLGVERKQRDLRAQEGRAGPKVGRGRVAPPFVARPGSEMASQPPGAPSSAKALDQDGKTALRRSNVQLSSLHIRDGAHRPRKLPWVALVRACGRFKLLLLEARRGRLLSSLNPLAMGNDLPPPKKHWMPEKAAFWGDQEPLSKVRTAPRGRGCGLFPTGAESSRAGKGAWEGAIWLARPGPSPLPQAHLVGRVTAGGRGQLEERLGGPGKPSWGRGTLPN